MSRYFKCFREFVRACLVEEFEYRTNFAANLVSTLFGLLTAILTVKLYFYRTEQIGGWSLYEVLVLLGIFTVVHGFIDFCLQPNMSRLVDHIRKGTLDYVLMKPVDSQFFVSFRHLVFWRLADVLLGFGLCGYALYRLGEVPSGRELLLFLIMLVSALAVVYSFWIFMMTISFWAVKVDNLSYLFTSFFETARFPVSVYKGALRLMLTYVFPVAFITTFPASAIVKRTGWMDAGISIVVALAALALTRQFWLFALRRYTSASS